MSTFKMTDVRFGYSKLDWCDNVLIRMEGFVPSSTKKDEGYTKDSHITIPLDQIRNLAKLLYKIEKENNGKTSV